VKEGESFKIGYKKEGDLLSSGFRGRAIRG